MTTAGMILYISELEKTVEALKDVLTIFDSRDKWPHTSVGSKDGIWTYGGVSDESRDVIKRAEKALANLKKIKEQSRNGS